MMWWYMTEQDITDLYYHTEMIRLITAKNDPKVILRIAENIPIQISIEERDWLVLMCKRALMLADMHLQSHNGDSEKIKTLIRKLEH